MPSGRRRGPRGSRRNRWLLAVTLSLVLAATLLRVFVFPPVDVPRRTDLVVVLGGLDTASRQDTGRETVASYPGSTMLVFVAELRYCPERPPAADDVVCLLPDPATTRGEAQMSAAFARERGLASMAVVTTPDQSQRARLRFSRCWDQELIMVQAPTSVWRVVA